MESYPWKVEYNYEDRFYYLLNIETNKSIKVQKLTEFEISEKEYQRYYDKVYTACQIANGNTVYLTRRVNGKKFIYKYTPKGIKK